jgi:hypothetical protein
VRRYKLRAEKSIVRPVAAEFLKVRDYLGNHPFSSEAPAEADELE